MKAFFKKHERLTKILLLLFIVISFLYIAYSISQAFSGYKTQSVTGKRYANKDKTKFIYFTDEYQGMYIYNDDGAAEFFTYAIKDGRIDVIYNNETTLPTTYYLISSDRLYSRKSNLIFYEFSA